MFWEGCGGVLICFAGVWVRCWGLIGTMLEKVGQRLRGTFGRRSTYVAVV